MTSSTKKMFEKLNVSKKDVNPDLQQEENDYPQNSLNQAPPSLEEVLANCLSPNQQHKKKIS